MILARCSISKLSALVGRRRIDTVGDSLTEKLGQFRWAQFSYQCPVYDLPMTIRLMKFASYSSF